MVAGDKKDTLWHANIRLQLVCLLMWRKYDRKISRTVSWTHVAPRGWLSSIAETPSFKLAKTKHAFKSQIKSSATYHQHHGHIMIIKGHIPVDRQWPLGMTSSRVNVKGQSRTREDQSERGGDGIGSVVVNKHKHKLTSRLKLRGQRALTKKKHAVNEGSQD